MGWLEMFQSVGANPFRLIGLAWLRSSLLVSTLTGCFLAHSMHIVVPGSASRRAGAIAFPHKEHSFLGSLAALVMAYLGS
jgi:hypothetical protein